MCRRPTAVFLIIAWFVAVLVPALPAPDAWAQDSVTAEPDPTAPSPAVQPPVAPPPSSTNSPGTPADTGVTGAGVTGADGTPETKPHETPDAARQEDRSWLQWFWDLPSDKPLLDRAAVLAIAFLAAFLTVLQIWRVPRKKSMFVKEENEEAEGSAPQLSEQEAKNLSFYFLQNNVGRAAISGLGGMVALTFLQSLWDSKEVNAKAYYLVCFVLFFVVLLVFFALAQASNEALRSRLVHRRWNITWTVFFDTFFTFLQGKNQLKTGPFTQEILQLQAANLRTVDEVCKQIFKAIRSRFSEVEGFNLDQLSDYGVRVSVSVLARDHQSTYYVSKPSGNLNDPFGKNTMAWLAIYTGHALWWRDDYDPQTDSGKQFQSSLVLPRRLPELPDPAEAEKKVPEEGKPQPLVVDPRTYHSDSRDSDYEAYVVIPIPLRLRNPTGHDVRAGIHISLRQQDWLKILWPQLEADPPEPAAGSAAASAEGTGKTLIQYQDWQKVLDLRTDSEDILGRKIYEADQLLSDLLRNFNEKLFESTLRPQLETQR